uniref:Uncharacterized protein n=1 Tax=Vitis vinifera TaxID=29760 RepID=F6GWD7_VITVI
MAFLCSSPPNSSIYLASSSSSSSSSKPRLVLVVPSAILAVLIHPRHFHHRLLTRIIWSFSFYLGAISVLPQLRLMQNAKVN